MNRTVDLTQSATPACGATVPERHQLHFTPMSASWLNQVERFFSLLTERQAAKPMLEDQEQRQVTRDSMVAVIARSDLLH
jgi:hypothetical protein